ncbi:MAG: hypothetical protein V9E94_01100 [Microthrixaceae bacterium]
MSSAATNTRTGAATFILAVATAAVLLLAAPLVLVVAALMAAVAPTRPVLMRCVAAVVGLLREAVVMVALGVLWVGSPLLGGAGSQRLVRAHTLLLGWLVRGLLRDRAVLLGAALVAETIPDDLVLDHRPPEDRRTVVVFARPGGEADALVLAHVIVNVYRRRALSVPPGLVSAPVAGRAALPLTLGRLSRPSDGLDGCDAIAGRSDGALLVISALGGRELADQLEADADADVLFVAHRGWPGELRVAQWSAHHDDIPADSPPAPDARAEWLDGRLTVVQEWLDSDFG